MLANRCSFQWKISTWMSQILHQYLTYNNKKKNHKTFLLKFKLLRLIMNEQQKHRPAKLKPKVKHIAHIVHKSVLIYYGHPCGVEQGTDNWHRHFLTWSLLLTWLKTQFITIMAVPYTYSHWEVKFLVWKCSWHFIQYLPAAVGSIISTKLTFTWISTPTNRATFSRIHCSCRIPVNIRIYWLITFIC